MSKYQKLFGCDAPACPALALRVIRMLRGELYFCNHHFRKFETELIGYKVQNAKEFANV